MHLVKNTTQEREPVRDVGFAFCYSGQEGSGVIKVLEDHSVGVKPNEVATELLGQAMHTIRFHMTYEKHPSHEAEALHTAGHV